MTTHLPKRNPLVLLLYLALVFGMFIFMLTVAYLPLQEEDSYSPASTDSPSHKTPAPTQAKANDSKNIRLDKKSQSRIKHAALANHQGVKIVVSKKTEKLVMNANLESKINQLWEAFYADQPLQKIKPRDNTVYVVYRQTNFIDNTTHISLGYASNKSLPVNHYESIVIPKGEYFTADNIFNGWQNLMKTQLTPNNTLGFEVYQLDKQYNIQSQKAYIAIKSL